MNILTWSEVTQRGAASLDGKAFGIENKPVLSFAFDGLYYEDTQQRVYADGQWRNLTPAEKIECDAFIQQAATDIANKVLGVDAKGNFLGYVAPDQAFKVAPIRPPTASDRYQWDFDGQRWIMIGGVDQDGRYLGFPVHVDDVRFFASVPNAPEFSYQVWDFAAKTWKDGRTLAQMQLDLCNQLDVLADQTALRYVTPGQTQGARYQSKLDNCQAYKAAGYPDSDTPANIDQTLYPYVYWETTQTDQTGQEMADGCIAQAAAWGVKGGQIEGYRIGGKTAINKAATPTDAQTAFAAAEQNLIAV